MNREIKYSGYSAVPSDYESPDGDLALSLNLINEDGHLKPLPDPKVILRLADNESVVYIHNVYGDKNYILARGDTSGSFSLLWLRKSDDVSDTSEAVFIGSYSGLRDITAVGNTLVLALDCGLRYALWKDDAYISLNARPPFVSIDFGLYRCGTLSDSEKFSVPRRCSPSWDGSRGKAEKTELAELTQMAYGLLNSAVAENVTSQGFFYQPFFVRYAYRLYDGSYSWHSAPILMLPMILPPFICYVGEESGSDDYVNATLALNVPYFALAYRILADGVDELSDWTDLVSGIGIFISAPIYTYDQSKDLPWRPVTTTRSILLNVSPDYVGGRGGSVPSKVFYGHYADSINDRYVDHLMNTGNVDNPHYYPVLNIRPHENFYRNIQSTHLFYKIAELDIKDIKRMTDMADLKFTESDLSSLVSRPTLDDEYQSHCNLVPSSLYSFNSRLNLAGVRIAPAEPFPLRSAMQFGNPEGISPTRVRITVWTRINGSRCSAVHSGEGSYECDMWFYPPGNFPRFLYYPDAAAYKMEIYITDSQKYVFNLTPHDFLNGAYLFLGKESMGNSPIPSGVEPESEECGSSVGVGAKIYTSEVNNPYLFPLLGINTVGTGSVLGICSAAKALSQGQFGQFPLYAFTSEGVWALETNSQGTYSARQPITRDVCINPDGITQIDSAVLFPTDRGIMLISGSQTQCISEPLNSDSPFSPLSLPGMDSFRLLLGLADDSLSIVPFSDFISDCGMTYDYVHQRIIVFSPSHSYAYVYSLKSKLWGMMRSSLLMSVNSYPEALAVDKSGSLVDFSQSDDSKLSTLNSQLLISRPLKLGAPDILKTINTMIQRGRFRSGHVRCALYGSRDLFSWHLVRSSQDHRLHGFRGTPYKYFRIALLCSLEPDESLSGCSLDFTPRFTNRLR